MRSRAARLRQPASVEDVDFKAPRGLDRALFLKLVSCDFIHAKHNLIITGPCGVGKSWLACALGQKACRDDLSVLYHRVPRLFTSLALSRGDGRYSKLMSALGKTRLLILDDWGPEILKPEQARDFLELVEERTDTGSILITSQVPVDRWHEMIGSPTLADAILDRLVHNAYRVELAGDSLRKRRTPPAA
jgi:DNA replication protein DnaC